MYHSAQRRVGWPTLLLAACIGASALLAPGCAYTGGIGNYFRNGFKVGPQYRTPAAAVAPDWIDSYDERILHDLPRCNDWWEVFHDPQMTSLVFAAYDQNLTLQEAGLRVLGARTQLGIAAGSLFPQRQQIVGNYTRRQISKTALDNRPLIDAGVPRAFDRWNTGFEAAWEIDIWGQFRREIESASANLDATIAQYDDVLVSLQAETASSYVDIRTLQRRLELARANVKAQKGVLEIAKSRYEVGETDELDVYQAQTNVSNTEALIPQLEQFERDAQIRLCILLGMPPRDLTPELGIGPIPTAPSTVALGIPADLLRRRPDVRKAEREVAAQSAQIGVAAADMLPQFSIRGSIRYDAEELNDLFQTSSAAGIISPGFRWNVLNYCRLRNNAMLQDVRFRGRVVHYRETVLRANADVERAVVAFLKAQSRVLYLEEGVEANRKALEIAVDQYKEGEITYNQIFTLQSFLVEEQDALAQEQGDVARSLISIYRALGGGWQIRCGYGAAAVHTADFGEPVLFEEIETPAGSSEEPPPEAGDSGDDDLPPL